MKKILLIVLPVLAFLGGGFAGGMLAGPSESDSAAKDHATAEKEGVDSHGDDGHGGDAGRNDGHGDDHGDGGSPDALSWYRFPSQFFIPLIRQGQVADIMVVRATIEMPKSAEEEVYRQEHRLRDALLRQMLIHANSGGFDGNFTSEAHLQALRRELLVAARQVSGDLVHAVLIEDIVKQKP